MDRWDWMTGIGVALIGAAIYLVFGLPAVIAYSGVVVALIGLAGALARRWPVAPVDADPKKPPSTDSGNSRVT